MRTVIAAVVMGNEAFAIIDDHKQQCGRVTLLTGAPVCACMYLFILVVAS